MLKRAIKNHDSDDSNNMSAMTDVVFLLLIFFVATMSAYVETTLLEANLPNPKNSQGSIPLKDVVRLDVVKPNEDYSYIVNGSKFTSRQLEKLLSRYKRLMPKAKFLLKCDPESEHQQLVTILASFAKNKLKNISLVN